MRGCGSWRVCRADARGTSIAGKLGVNVQRIYVWFNATGKKMKEIKKVKPATYAWVV